MQAKVLRFRNYPGITSRRASAGLIQPLHGSVQHYPWGTEDAIPELLEVRADGRPWAEYWLGAHPSGPGTLGGGDRLDHILHAQPELLGAANREAFGEQLPFLVKVLSARHALSLQAHPSRAQAEDGFARENAAGVPLDAPQRLYRDAWPKPEMMIALDEFHALCGFRDPAATVSLFDGLGVAGELEQVLRPLKNQKDPTALADTFLNALNVDEARTGLVGLVTAAAREYADSPGELGEFARTAVELSAIFPADPGILAALMLHRIILAPGEAVFVPSGCLHSHLRGTGIEVMANSDNVIRGGLTTKYIDTAELLNVVDFSVRRPVITRPTPLAPGVMHYVTGCPEFDVWRLDPATADCPVPGEGSARVVLVSAGEIELTSDQYTLQLRKGGAAFIGASEGGVRAAGDGVAFVTASGLR